MNNSKRIFSAFAVLILTFNSINSYSQHNHGSHDHGHGHQMKMSMAPHGGELREVGKYTIELVTNNLLKEDQLSFFLFKGNLKPMSNDGITGVITYFFTEDSVLTEDLNAKGDDMFVAQLKGSNSFKAKVDFTIDAKLVSFMFHHNGQVDDASQIYTCPMHKDVKSINPGSCPKCGMKLEKQ